jgi:exodeoxyribonuclease V beta subunit
VLDPDASALDEREALADAGADDAAWLVPVLPELADEPPHPALSALAPVRGADFGNALHAIMEHRVIGRTLREQPELVMQELQAAGVRSNELDLAELAPLLITRLDQVIGAPLGLHDAVSFCLGDLKPAQIRAEMEFHFRLDYVSMSALQRACADHGEPTLVPAQSRTLLGLMNGKIDLLFEQGGRVHVLDYKGNYLGEQLADYRGQALVEAMNAHDYRFQALIYTIALERYLHQRLGDAYRRERHLGECVYLFMRAVGLEEGAGIWRHRFDPALLDAVADVFAGTLEDAA